MSSNTLENQRRHQFKQRHISGLIPSLIVFLLSLFHQSPPEFVSSKNRKWIVVQGCKATFKDKLVGDVIMHADFIQRDHFLDYSCCFVNEDASRDVAKYEIINDIKTFRIWFTDLKQNPVTIEDFALKLLLIY